MKLAVTLVATAAALAPAIARAETWLVPVGTAVVRLDGGRVACPDAHLPDGWSVDADGRALRAPAGGDAAGQSAVFTVAATPAACATAAAPLQVYLVGRAPAVDAASVVVDADARTLTVRGHAMRGSRLRWRARGATGSDACADPATTGDVDACTFDLARAGAVVASETEFELLPPGAPDVPDAIFVDATGRRVDPVRALLSPARILVARLLPEGAAVDLTVGDGRVAFEHPDAVAGVSCPDAVCTLDEGALVVREVRADDDALSVQVRLRPHVYYARDGARDAAPVLRVALQRCPVAVASIVPWRGLLDPRVVLRVGGACARGGSIAFASDAGPLPIVQSAVVGEQRYVVLQLDRVGADGVSLTMRRANTVIGSVRARPAAAVVGRSRLEGEGLGVVDFLPTNRPVRVAAPAIPGSGALVPVAVEGAYDVTRRGGTDYAQGIAGASGAVSLRLALRDASLPAPLDQVDLGVLVEPVDRALRPASVPVALRGAASLVELVCGDDGGHASTVAAGVTVALPFRARDTCALVFHRERLRPEDGAQRLRVVVSVTGADGDVRADAGFDRRLALGPDAAPRQVTLRGVASPFDRVVVRVGHVEDDEGAASPDDAEVQWSIVFGTSRGRLYATATIPTGLFRVADAGHTGILSLNAGALFRLAYLSAEGAEFPVGLETGVMWVGIAGDTDPATASRGQVALVAGVGLSVPIANRTHATQTSIGLHVWMEYEVSRALASGAGSPFGLVFGPSLSIGDVGTNF